MPGAALDEGQQSDGRFGRKSWLAPKEPRPSLVGIAVGHPRWACRAPGDEFDGEGCERGVGSGSVDAAYGCSPHYDRDIHNVYHDHYLDDADDLDDDYHHWDYDLDANNLHLDSRLPITHLLLCHANALS